MEPQEKICKVIKYIKDKKEISPNPKRIEFIFSTSIVGAGIVTDDEKRDILLKLEKEGLIKIISLFRFTDDRFKNLSHEGYVRSADKVFIESLEELDKYHKENCKVVEKVQVLKTINFWHYSNPFWWLWQLWLFIRKHKIISSVIILITLLGIDYSQTWRNIKFIISLLKFK